jgi:hypothetical protein
MQSFTCSGWRGKGERRKKKRQRVKAYLTRKSIGDILGVASKTDEWLLVATAAEVQLRKWPKWWTRRGGKKKN